MSIHFSAIDVLDVLKKGSDAKNIHARDAIRYLDTQLQKRQLSQPSSLDREHFIRAQNINEKLSSWNEAEEYLIDQRWHNEEAEETEEDQDDYDARPIISACLYYIHIGKTPNFFLVTEDAECQKYAQRFSIPLHAITEV